jgi:hypothetical protein
MLATVAGASPVSVGPTMNAIPASVGAERGGTSARDETTTPGRVMVPP